MSLNLTQSELYELEQLKHDNRRLKAENVALRRRMDHTKISVAGTAKCEEDLQDRADESAAKLETVMDELSSTEAEFSRLKEKFANLEAERTVLTGKLVLAEQDAAMKAEDSERYASAVAEYQRDIMARMTQQVPHDYLDEAEIAAMDSDKLRQYLIKTTAALRESDASMADMRTLCNATQDILSEREADIADVRSQLALVNEMYCKANLRSEVMQEASISRITVVDVSKFDPRQTRHSRPCPYVVVYKNKHVVFKTKTPRVPGVVSTWNHAGPRTPMACGDRLTFYVWDEVRERGDELLGMALVSVDPYLEALEKEDVRRHDLKLEIRHESKSRTTPACELHVILDIVFAQRMPD